MKLAIVGSRTLTNVDIKKYLPEGVREIVSGGAMGVDTCAANYAKANGIPLKCFLPKYKLYGRKAPLLRNLEIAAYADEALVFWDGKSRGTNFTINAFKAENKNVKIIICEE